MLRLVAKAEMYVGKRLRVDSSVVMAWALGSSLPRGRVSQNAPQTTHKALNPK